MNAQVPILLSRRGFVAGAMAAASLPALNSGTSAAEGFDMRRALGGDGDITDLLATMRRQGISRGWLAAGRYTVAPGTPIDGIALEGAGRGTLVRPRPGGRSAYLLEAAGSVRPLPSLAASVRRGETAFELTARATCRPGDLVQLFDPRRSSFSRSRGVYRNGEFAIIARVEGNRIHLQSPLTRDADAAFAQLRSLVAAPLRLSNMRFETGAMGALRAVHCRGPVLENLIVRNAAPHGIYLDRCYDLSVTGLAVDNRGSGSSSDYGLAIGNCQTGVVSGGSFYGRRHGLALGGGDFEDGIPTRAITVRGASIANSLEAGTPAADMHGNCEQIHYRDCHIVGGAMLGGVDGSYTRCEISAMTNGTCVYASEIGGGEFVLEDCLLSSSADPSQGYRGIVDFGGNSIAIGPHTERPVGISVLGCRVVARGLGVASRIVEIRNRGARVPIDVRIDGLELDVDALGTVVSVRDQAGNAWRGRIELAGVRGKPPSARELYSAAQRR